MDDIFGKPPTMPWLKEFHTINNVWEKQMESKFKKPFLQYQAKLNFKSEVPSNFNPVRVLVTITKDFKCSWLEEILACGIAGIRIVVSFLDEVFLTNILEKIKLANDIYSMKIGGENLVIIILEIESYRVRIGTLKSNKVKSLKLEAGTEVTLTTNEDYREHVTQDTIFVDYQKLVNVVQAGDKIIFNNGFAELSVDKIKNEQVLCTVEKTGNIISNESLTIPGAPIKKKKMDFETHQHIMDFVLENDVNAINIFDTYEKKDLVDTLNIIGQQTHVFATVDNLGAIQSFNTILLHCDGVFLDLKKLQLEMQKEKTFIAQKSLIVQANMFQKPILSTLEFSDGKNLSKSECADIANLVLDGVDGFLIPQDQCTVETISNINKIAREASAAFYYEKNFDGFLKNHQDPQISVAINAVRTSQMCKAAAIICTTTSGSTTKFLSYFKPLCPIIVITKDRDIARYLKLYHSIDTVLLKKKDYDLVKNVDERIDFGISYAKRKKYTKMGDAVVTVSLFSHDFLSPNCIRVFYCSKTGFSAYKCSNW